MISSVTVTIGEVIIGVLVIIALGVFGWIRRGR